jgi:hypothetical protein
VKLPALKGGASRKGKYLFQIASLNPALKGGACREANRSIFNHQSSTSVKVPIVFFVFDIAFSVKLRILLLEMTSHRFLIHLVGLVSCEFLKCIVIGHELFFSQFFKV